MSLNWSGALRAAGGEGSRRSGPSALTRQPGGAVSGRRVTRLGLQKLGGILALLLASLVAPGKLLSQIEFQFYYL